MPLEGIDACKKSDFIYIERYTNVFENDNLEELQKIIGKKIIELSRDELEVGFEKSILPLAKDKNISLIISGDPL
ncbi:MAG: diphthine synthase, partial [Candidatus Omnitrophica bacterium]|nr:diphthine synthase [Candidatus Omnitrophota bacterium]